MLRLRFPSSVTTVHGGRRWSRKVATAEVGVNRSVTVPYPYAAHRPADQVNDLVCTQSNHRSFPAMHALSQHANGSIRRSARSLKRGITLNYKRSRLSTNGLLLTRRKRLPTRNLKMASLCAESQTRHLQQTVGGAITVVSYVPKPRDDPQGEPSFVGFGSPLVSRAASAASSAAVVRVVRVLFSQGLRMSTRAGFLV